MNMLYREYISVEDYNKLREAVGWGSLCEEQARAGLNNSAYVISCYDGEKTIGTARVIWDGGYIAYLSDVMVLPECQGLGYGKQMVLRAIQYMKSQLKPNWKIKLVLLAAKDKEKFYEKFGFQERPNKQAGAGMEMWL